MSLDDLAPVVAETTTLGRVGVLAGFHVTVPHAAEADLGSAVTSQLDAVDDAVLRNKPSHLWTFRGSD